MRPYTVYCCYRTYHRRLTGAHTAVRRAVFSTVCVPCLFQCCWCPTISDCIFSMSPPESIPNKYELFYVTAARCPTLSTIHLCSAFKSAVALQVRLLTEHGFSHTMLHSNNSTVKVMKCRDLNSTRLIAAAPDLSMNTRAYGISADGEFVSLALPGEKRILSCRCDDVISCIIAGCTCEVSLCAKHLHRRRLSSSWHTHAVAMVHTQCLGCKVDV